MAVKGKVTVTQVTNDTLDYDKMTDAELSEMLTDGIPVSKLTDNSENLQGGLNDGSLIVINGHITFNEESIDESVDESGGESGGESTEFIEIDFNELRANKTMFTDVFAICNRLPKPGEKAAGTCVDIPANMAPKLVIQLKNRFSVKTGQTRITKTGKTVPETKMEKEFVVKEMNGKLYVFRTR